MTKIILFKQEKSTDKSPDYNVVTPVKQDNGEEKLVTVGAAWNKTSANGNIYKSIAWKKDKFVKEDGTVYPAVSVRFKGEPYTFASIFNEKKDTSKYFLSLSEKVGDTFKNEFGSKNGGVVGEGDKARLELDLKEEVEFVYDYGDMATGDAPGQKAQSEADYNNIEFPTDDINPEDIPF